MHTLLSTRMLVLKLGQIVHIVVYNDPKVVPPGVLGDIAFTESLGHGCWLGEGGCGSLTRWTGSGRSRGGDKKLRGMKEADERDHVYNGW